MKIFRRYFNPLAEMLITRMLLKMSLIHNVLIMCYWSSLSLRWWQFWRWRWWRRWCCWRWWWWLSWRWVWTVLFPNGQPVQLIWAPGLASPWTGWCLGGGRYLQGPAGSSQTAGYRARGDDGTTVGPRSLPATPLQFHNVCSHGVCHHHHHRCCRCFRSLLRHKDTLPLARIEFSVLAPSAEFMSDGVTVDFTLVCGPRKAAHE